VAELLDDEATDELDARTKPSGSSESGLFFELSAVPPPQPTKELMSAIAPSILKFFMLLPIIGIMETS
jgi:hypothetical protein